MSENDAQKVLKSIRKFLHAEEKAYGPFVFPEGQNLKNSDEKQDKEATSSDLTEKKASQKREKKGDMQNNFISDGFYEGIHHLDDLREEALKADYLRTDLPDTKLVFGVGDPKADILIIGEAPGLQEDKQGEPFVGRAGQLLNKILEAISIDRKEVYITNILKHRPPNNRDPQPAERERSLPLLFRQIELIDPKIIVCLGRIAAQTLLETEEPMKTLRGRFHTFKEKTDLMVTYHPAYLLRNPSAKRATWEDVKMLRKHYDQMQK